MDEVFRVEVDREGCSYCRAVPTWAIVGPDGRLGVTFDDKADADDYADDLNMAFEMGRAAK